MTDKKQTNEQQKKEFKRTYTYDMPDGERVLYVSLIFEKDRKGERDGKYGKEDIYEFKLLTEEGEKDATLYYNKTDKALGSIKVDGSYYTIWQNKNSKGKWNSFKMNDEYYNFEERISKNGNKYFKIVKVVKKEEPLSTIPEEEIDF